MYSKINLFFRIITMCLCAAVSVLVNPVYGRDTSTAKAPVDYADTIVGTGRGRTYTGANMPFGMVQLAPDTRTGEAVASGYYYSHKTIEGFSMNHMSGVGWRGTLGNFQIMPTTGDVKFHSGSNDFDKYKSKDKGWKSNFSHANETAEPGYYKVKLDSYDIWSELTCTQRTGMLWFTFPKSDSSTIQIDLARKIGGGPVVSIIML
jgi:putative alpha-1,2-mannosidase